jgi:hypothetical protein
MPVKGDPEGTVLACDDVYLKKESVRAIGSFTEDMGRPEGSTEVGMPLCHGWKPRLSWYSIGGDPFSLLITADIMVAQI